jgi:alanyl-tRNA synthetase
MRRAIQQGRALELEPGFLTRYGERVTELMGGTYPELHEHRPAIEKWLSSEEESFGRTLEQGMSTLALYIDQARDAGRSSVPAAEIFRLHDTYGFPYEVTTELLAQEGLSIEGDFERLMEEQRARGRASARAGGTAAQEVREAASSFAGEAGVSTRFTGYETECQQTTMAAVQSIAPNGSADSGAGAGERYLVKLAESPFYAAGGGQVADAGVIECEHGDCRARVEDVFRVGADQALAVVVEEGTLRPGEPVVARVDHLARHATEANHTATHLLQAALRERVGSHVRQAGSYVGPDKLRFDFSHGQALSAEELRDVEDRVNEWIARNDPVRPITTTLDEAKRLGAMALFGEKYGDVVRMVEIGEGDYSRELCGGTHVRSTAEIGVFHILGETSSAANVRRIEAVTGPAAVELLRERDRLLEDASATLRTRPEQVPDAVRTLTQERRQLEKALKEGGSSAGGAAGTDIDQLAAQASDVAGAPVLATTVDVADAKGLLDVADRLRGRLKDAAIVLGAAADGRAHLVVSVSPPLVERGLKAGAIVKLAAEVVGGGGGGRDTMAQAGGRDPEKLGDAIAAARAEIESVLGS